MTQLQLDKMIGDDVPQQAVSLIKKLLKKDPKYRYSAKSIIKLLNAEPSIKHLQTLYEQLFKEISDMVKNND